MYNLNFIFLFLVTAAILKGGRNFRTQLESLVQFITQPTSLIKHLPNNQLSYEIRESNELHTKYHVQIFNLNSNTIINFKDLMIFK